MLAPIEQLCHGPRPMVVAHRGNSGVAPENTLIAIRQGVEAGAEMVEIDVQRTADGTLIVFHDAVLGRTTNGSGKVSAFTYEELSRLDAGSWMGSEYAGEPIPLLSDVLAYLRGRAYLNIELKRHPGGNDPDGARFLDDVLGALHDAGVLGQVLMSSFDHELLARAREVEPAVPCAVILHPEDRALPSERALPVGAKAVVLGKHQLSHARMADAREHHLPVGVYTINTPDEALRAAQYGARALVSNFPGRVIDVLVSAVPARDAA